jgi:hypothetical protein
MATKIMSAMLHPTGATRTDGTPCEWAWTEASEEDFGREWNGNVEGYVENAADNAEDINRAWTGDIHNLPGRAVVLVNADGQPYQIFWAESTVRKLFDDSGMTQQQLSDKSGINIRQIQHLLAGDRLIENTTLVNAVKLADALGVDDLRELL